MERKAHFRGKYELIRLEMKIAQPDIGGGPRFRDPCNFLSHLAPRHRSLEKEEGSNGQSFGPDILTRPLKNILGKRNNLQHLILN